MERKRLMEYLSIRASLRRRCCDSQGGAIEVKGVEDAKERVPEICVREGLVRQRAGPADLHRDVVVGRQGQQLWQIGERVGGGRRLVLVAGRGGHELRNTTLIPQNPPGRRMSEKIADAQKAIVRGVPGVEKR
jgi:hypothetical protein